VRPRPAGTAPATLGVVEVRGERGRARKANRNGGLGRSRRGETKPHLTGAGEARERPGKNSGRAAPWGFREVRDREKMRREREREEWVGSRSRGPGSGQIGPAGPAGLSPLPDHLAIYPFQLKE
jgi:hypothetical protein